MTPGGSILFRVPAVASRLSCLSGNLSGRWNSAPPAQYKRLRRCFSTEQPGGGEKDYSPAPTSDVLPHASEEAAALGKIRGEGGPQIEEQGTPIQEIIKDDSKLQSKLPEVLKESLKSPAVPSGTRRYSTTTTESAGDASHDQMVESFQVATIEGGEQPEMDPFAEERALWDESNAELQALVHRQEHVPRMKGLKFDPPSTPVAATVNFKERYDPIQQQVTTLLMRHGKLAKAQTDVALILAHLRTSAPPRYSARHPLIAGAPPPHHLPLYPLQYLTIALDSVAPLLRLRQEHGAAGGGEAVQVPVPLTMRQRRRKAMLWILQAASAKKEKGGKFAIRVAEEVVAVVEGRSGAWDKRAAIHSLAMVARTNVGYKRRKRTKIR